MYDRLGSIHEDYLDPDKHLWGSDFCGICGKDVDAKPAAFACDCPECPECGEHGNPECYENGHLKPAPDSVQSFCDHFGIEPLGTLLRAVDKYNVEGMKVWLRVPVGNGRHLIGCDDHDLFPLIKPWMRIGSVRVFGIAWDGTDWEWCQTVPSKDGWEAVSAAREAFNSALEEHNAEVEADGDSEYL